MADQTDPLELLMFASPGPFPGDEEEEALLHEADLLDHVRVASPCAASWDEMAGDDEVRFCWQCEQNVYNLSWMSRREAAAFVRETEGRLCVRLYRRHDGTLRTDDCPVGLRAARREQVKFAGSIAAVAVAVLGVLTPVLAPLTLVGLASFILVGLWGCPTEEADALGQRTPAAVSRSTACERSRQTVLCRGAAPRPRYRRPWNQRWGRGHWG